MNVRPASAVPIFYDVVRARDLADTLSVDLSNASRVAASIARDIGHDNALVRAHVLADEVARARGLSNELVIINAQGQALSPHITPGLSTESSFNSAYARARACVDALVADLSRADALIDGETVPGRDKVRDLAHLRASASDLAYALAGYLDKASNYASAIAPSHPMDHADIRVVSRLSRRLTGWAARLLPPEMQSEYIEMFTSELHDLARHDSRRRTQLVHAIRVLVRAPLLRHELRGFTSSIRERT